MIIREESALDLDAIRAVNVAAFEGHPFSHQTEHLIVEELRTAGALTVSLVAEIDGRVVGHVAFSAASIGDTSDGWFLLGPLAVLPQYQDRGIGSALVDAGLDTLRSAGARGCVLVGDPAFYGRFGFRQRPGVTFHDVAGEYVLCLPLSGDTPTGEVSPHPAFSAGT